MKNNGANRSPVLRGTLKALGLLGVVGMAGAVVLIGPLAGSGCSDNNGGAGGSAGHAGLGGAIGSTGGSGGGGAGGAATDAGTDGTISATASQVLIQGFTYMPLQLTVAAGGTVTVHNVDTAMHSMTSESAVNAVVFGAVNGVSFNTGVIQPGGSASFTIPANAPSGTMIPFFCTVHQLGMPQGTLTVQ